MYFCLSDHGVVCGPIVKQFFPIRGYKITGERNNSE